MDDGGGAAVPKVRRVLRLLMLEHRTAPSFLRLSLHDALTFDKRTRIGGPNGSIASEREAGHPGNEGLRPYVSQLEALRAEECPSLSLADVIHLAGLVALESMGGAAVAFRAGRKDSRACPPRGRLPLAEKKNFAAACERVGLSARQTVALAGCWLVQEGFERQWTSHPAALDNSFFSRLLKDRAKTPEWGFLLDDPALQALVEEFARDEEAFIAALSDAVKAASETTLQGGAGAAKAEGGLASVVEALTGPVDPLTAAGIAAAAAFLAVVIDRRRRRRL